MPGSTVLTQVVERLSTAHDLETITAVVAEAARKIAGSDGSTFVLRDEDRCYYADENAISPLWKGKKFPADTCVSGWCMNRRETVLIPDIYRDPRVPHDAYRPTFVKSLCMVPIRSEAPIGALGSYWAMDHQPTQEEIKLLQILANCSAVALENMALRNAVRERSAERYALSNRQNQLEFQLNSLAHDMRNPLASILGYSEILKARVGAILQPRDQEYLDTIHRTGQRLNRQIERMLALYRLSNQTIRKQRVNLSEMVQELVEGMKLLQPQRKVMAEITPELMTDADPELIRLALENLVSNAFKYSSRKDVTWIKFGKTADSTGAGSFFIEDHGDGFEPAHAQKLFQPLVRLHRDADFPGTGLGLASVARIIELHGGRVEARGQPKQGATFSFTLN